jgi:hypothetical protein
VDTVDGTAGLQCVAGISHGLNAKLDDGGISLSVTYRDRSRWPEDSVVTASGLCVTAGHVIRDDRVKASVLFVKYADVTSEVVLSRGEWSHSFR